MYVPCPLALRHPTARQSGQPCTLVPTSWVLSLLPQVYTIYSILFIVFIILVIVTAFITVALTYFQLAVEDHR